MSTLEGLHCSDDVLLVSSAPVQLIRAGIWNIFYIPSKLIVSWRWYSISVITNALLFSWAGNSEVLREPLQGVWSSMWVSVHTRILLQATPFDFWFWFDLILIWITPEGFTTVVANEGLEKARAYLNQVPRDQQLYIPSEGCGVNFRWKHLQTTPTHFLGQSWVDS